MLLRVGEKYLQTHVKQRMSIEYIKNSQSSTGKKASGLWKTWKNKMKRHFSEEGIQILEISTLKMFKSISHRKVQIKTTMRYYFIPNRMAKTENNDNIKCQ